MIRVDHLSRSFAGAPALEEVSFEVKRGEVVGLLGPNGAGKTTCLRVLAGLLCPDAGVVEIDGVDMPRQSLEARRRTGYVAEGAPAPPDLRVEEFLRFRAGLRLARRRDRLAEVSRVTALCGLEQVRRRICGQLSRGYRQRLALADAMLGDPPLLILDEPMVGLDPNQRAHVRELVAALGGEHTVLLSSHLLGEVEAVCHRVVILNHGRVVARGDPAALRRQAGAELRLRLGGDLDLALAAESLLELPGVAAVTPTSDGDALRLRGEIDDALRAAVAAHAAAQGWVLLELADEPASLERAFARLTGEE